MHLAPRGPRATAPHLYPAFFNDPQALGANIGTCSPVTPCLCGESVLATSGECSGDFAEERGHAVRDVRIPQNGQLCTAVAGLCGLQSQVGTPYVCPSAGTNATNCTAAHPCLCVTTLFISPVVYGQCERADGSSNLVGAAKLSFGDSTPSLAVCLAMCSLHTVCRAGAGAGPCTQCVLRMPAIL